MEPLSFQGRPLSPRCVMVRRATLLPSRLRDEGLALEGGVYDAQGVLVPESLRPTRLGHWIPTAPVALPPAALEHAEEVPEAIFGGHLFLAWGHFLFETLSTAWATGLPEALVLFAAFAHRPEAGAVAQALARASPLLGAAGWGRRPLRVVTRPQRIGTLHVPERLAVFGTNFGETAAHPALAAVYARLRRRWPGGYRGPMMALRPEGHPREHPGERALGLLLEDHGVRRVAGARLSPEQQVEAFGGATAIIGFSGSNLHNLAFCPPGTPVIEITDARSTKGSERRNRTQAALADLLGQPYRVIAGFDGDGPGLGPPRLAEALVEEVRRALGEAPEPRALA